MRSNHIIVDSGGIDLTSGGIKCNLADSTGDLGTGTVVNGQRQRHTGMVGALGKAALKDVAGLLGQRGNITQKDNANVLALKQR